MSHSFMSDRAPEPVGPYPHARRAGNLLFVSGVGPRAKGSRQIPGVELDPHGNVVSYDVAEQCRATFRNVRSIVEDCGFRWNQVVDVTAFLVNMRRDFPIFNKIYAEMFAEPRPTRTTVEVGALPTPIAVELKVIAAADGS